MKIIKPSVEFASPVNGNAILRQIERCGRVCYKSEGRNEEGSAAKFAAWLLEQSHEEVLEHFSFTVKFICARSVSNEIRTAHCCEEPTCYCNYSNGGFENEITVVEPCFAGGDGHVYWKISCEEAERSYFNLLDYGWSKEEASSVLPLSLKTEVVMTANIREWRHFLKLRCAPSAHPQMREVARMLLEKVQAAIPVLFDDILDDPVKEAEKKGNNKEFDERYTLNECSELTGIAYHTLYAYIKSGRLQAHKSRNRWTIRRGDLAEFLNSVRQYRKFLI